MSATREPTESNRWWGDVDIPRGRTGHWRIGPLTLWIENRASEWRLAHEESAGEHTPGAEISLPCPAEEVPSTATLTRVAHGGDELSLRLSPKLADRPVVARPETSLRLRPRGEATLYVSTPLWIAVESLSPGGLLLDVPTARPSDSWFGTSTRDGELCYAVRTKARLDFDNIPVKPERAITKVRLRNLASDDLILERINVPSPSLSLFEAPDGHLWTQEITVTRKQDGLLAEVDFGTEPSDPGAESRQQIAGPRSHEQRNVLVRTLGALLG